MRGRAEVDGVDRFFLVNPSEREGGLLGNLMPFCDFLLPFRSAKGGNGLDGHGTHVGHNSTLHI